MGAMLGGAFGGLLQPLFPAGDISVPAFAMVGMAAMIGGGTGAAMTAVTMIFEMTLDYSIVVPMIIAVAIAIGIRRALSRENIYTIKLVARGHFIPKALHANMFLVRRAEDVMDRDILILPDTTRFDELLPHAGRAGKLCHIVVTHNDKIAGVLRVNTGLRQGQESAYAGVSLGDVALREYTVARAQDVMFNVIGRMWRRNSAMAVVVRGEGRIPRVGDVVGIVSKEHIADSVAEGIRPYAPSEPGV
jgi:CIC family chloride channel protein